VPHQDANGPEGTTDQHTFDPLAYTSTLSNTFLTGLSRFLVLDLDVYEGPTICSRAGDPSRKDLSHVYPITPRTPQGRKQRKEVKRCEG
jgi:hypothetical protein